MPGPPLNPEDLRILLAHLLASVAGHDDAYWLALLELKRTSIIEDIRTNWRLEISGSKQERNAIDSAEAVVRTAHPYVSW